MPPSIYRSKVLKIGVPAPKQDNVKPWEKWETWGSRLFHGFKRMLTSTIQPDVLTGRLTFAQIWYIIIQLSYISIPRCGSSLVERCVRDAEAAGSNPVISTNRKNPLNGFKISL